MVKDPSRETRSPSERPAWKAIEEHYRSIGNVHLRQLFDDDPKRGERFVVEAAGLYLDYSKNRVSDETIRLLIRLAEECNLRRRIEGMFRGERINVTENGGSSHTRGHECIVFNRTFGGHVEKKA
jgi:glucose-6-phosphate isomerase